MFDTDLMPGEGQICRWCQEGEYVIKPSEHGHLTADPSDDALECDVCGEPPNDFRKC